MEKEIPKGSYFSVILKNREKINFPAILYLTLLKDKSNEGDKETIYIDVGKGKNQYYISMAENSRVEVNIWENKVKIIKYNPDGNKKIFGEVIIEDNKEINYKLEVEREKDCYFIRSYGSPIKVKMYCLEGILNNKKSKIKFVYFSPD